MGAEPIVVVGAGAAGITAAFFAASTGQRVMLLERTRDGGRKILISGGGRCNVLPSEVDPARYVTESSSNTLRKMLLSWPLPEQREFFEREVGIRLALEPETGKLFPASNKARDVRDSLYALARRRGVELSFDANVEDVQPDSTAGSWRIRLANQPEMVASSLVLATGGLSVPATGSDGRGLTIAKRLGHTLHPTYPALTPLLAAGGPHAPLAGVSLEVALHAPARKRGVSSKGGFLFTHRGYSGPAILDVSHMAVRAESRTVQPVLVQWSALNAEAWERTLAGASTGLVITLLRRHLPDRLAGALLEEAGIPGDRSAAQLRRDERVRLVEMLTRYSLPWTGDEGYKKAEVTGGGVALGEVDPRTMESRIRPGLFLCGEILDAFGPIGGYNFLWAWATGRAAGLGAAAR
ncbi:aminoacetone oxidase family FAD-binding enzyme [soil metagenome]